MTRPTLDRVAPVKPAFSVARSSGVSVGVTFTPDESGSAKSPLEYPEPMGYEFVASLDEALWPVVHRALETDRALGLVTYGPRALALQWDGTTSPHAEEVQADFDEGVLRVVFHNGTRQQRDGVLARLREHLQAAGATIDFTEA